MDSRRFKEAWIPEDESQTSVRARIRGADSGSSGYAAFSGSAKRMQTAEMRRRLMRQMETSKDDCNWVVMTKCIAGLLVIVLIALFG